MPLKESTMRLSEHIKAGSIEAVNKSGLSEQQESIVVKMIDKGIVDPTAQANILSQFDAESNIKPISEKLNYKNDGVALFKTFPDHFKDLADASRIATLGEKAIGDRVYGSRMGNAGEGFKYRGRGFIQLTGKDNYKRYGDMLGLDLVNNPDLLLDPDIAADVGIAYMLDRSKDLTNPYENTKAVAPSQWKSKVEERGQGAAQFKESIASRPNALKEAIAPYSEPVFEPLETFIKRASNKAGRVYDSAYDTVSDAASNLFGMAEQEPASFDEISPTRFAGHIAYENGMTLDELQALNPEVEITRGSMGRALQSGQKLRVGSGWYENMA